MEVLNQYKVILWDFDGVIMDSMPTRSKGFEMVLKGFPQHQIDALLNYHNLNGGLSRYAKFRYFYETIRNETISEAEVMELANKFSQIMLENLKNAALLIEDSLNFIKDNYQKFKMHIVSGSDGNELREICKSLDIDRYFISIHGSPTPKNDLVKILMIDNEYAIQDVILIGDSKNDLEATVINNISFAGYNNPALENSTTKYIKQFSFE